MPSPPIKRRTFCPFTCTSVPPAAISSAAIKAIPTGVACSGAFNCASSFSSRPENCVPANATLFVSSPNSCASFSHRPCVWLPPPTRKTAVGALLLHSWILSAITFAKISTLGSIAFKIVSLVVFWVCPKISVYVIGSSFSSANFIVSAVSKSTRQWRIIASVISSPATVAMVYPATEPSFVIAISDVPAPISTIAKLSKRMSFGKTARMAAMGSNVSVSISRSISSMQRRKLLTTSLGRKVAITSTCALAPLCSKRLENA